MTSDYYVYILQRSNGSPFYVGMGRAGRVTSSAKIRKSDTNRYKQHVISLTLNEIGYIPYTLEREDLTESEAKSEEVRIISYFGRYPNGPLVNMTDGGDGGCNPSPEVRERLRQTKLGNTWNKGRVISDERMSKLREAANSFMRSDRGLEHVRKFHLGKKRSKETCDKIKEKRASQIFTDESRMRMRIAQQERWRRLKEAGVDIRKSPEHREKLRQAVLAYNAANPDHAVKIGEKLRGRTQSERSRKKMREGQQRRREREAHLTNTPEP